MSSTVAAFLVVAALNGPVAFGGEAKAAGRLPNTSSADGSLVLQSREITEAAVGSLRKEMGLSDAEARLRFAAQSRLDVLGQKLLGQLGDRRAGAWIDPVDGALVVNVLDARDAGAVRSAGAHARVVRHSTLELQRIVDRLEKERLPRGSSWGIDPQADAVVVEMPAGESLATSARYGDAVITRHDTASARSLIGTAAQQAPADAGRTDLYGGLAINRSSPGGFKCTSGFLATDPDASGGFKFDYLLTAGHCGTENSTWYRGSSKIGFMSHRELGPNDFGTIALTNNSIWQPQPWVFTRSGPQPVNGSAQVTVTGTTVCMRGARNSYNCGQVTAFDTSYVDSTTGIQVSGLDKTALCAGPGDSGAPVMVPQGNGVLGVGLISGGATTSTGACQGVTWVEPLWKALNGIKLVTSH